MEIPGRIGIYFTLPGPEGRSGDCVYVCLCVVCLSDIWAWTRTRKRPQEGQMIFSHGQFCMTPLRRKNALEQTVYCIEPSDELYQWHHTLLWNWLLQCMWRSLWIPMGSLVDAEIMLPTSKQKEKISNEHFFLTVNNIHTFNMNTHIIGPTVVWPKGGVCCVVLRVRLCGISCSTPILSLGSSGGQPLKWLTLALANGSDIERHSIFDTRLWLIVKKRWVGFVLGSFLKTWRSSPPPLGMAWQKWNPWIMNTLKGEQLFTAANLVFMEVILVVSGRELMF